MGKDPGIAAVASLLLLGGGQFYNEQWLKGLLFIIGAVFSVILVIIHPAFLALFLVIGLISVWDAVSVAKGGSGISR